MKKNGAKALDKIEHANIVIQHDRAIAAGAKSRELKKGAPHVEGSKEDIRRYLREHPIKRY